MRKCKFYRNQDVVCVIRPTNWLDGWNRQRWLERYFKTEEIRNLSAEFWIDNVGTNIVLELVYENGEYREEISSSMIL